MENKEVLARYLGETGSGVPALIDELEKITAHVREQEDKFRNAIVKVKTPYRVSAKNLVHYTAVRQRDISEIQDKLSSLGLSSLGRAESHVMGTLNSVLAILHTINGTSYRPGDLYNKPLSYKEGEELLDSHTEALLGAPPAERNVRIMVTLPSEAAADYRLVRDLVRAGMNCARINCAHDDPAAWAKMAKHVRSASIELSAPCRILMDLAGPKLRTGDVEPGPKVLKLRPERDAFGSIASPQTVLLSPKPPKPGEERPYKTIWITPRAAKKLKIGDVITFRDARNAKRSLIVSAKDASGAYADCFQTAYITPKTKLFLRGANKDGEKTKTLLGYVKDMPAAPKPIRLEVGDALIITADQTPGRPAVYNEKGVLLQNARIPCSMPEIFADIKPGERIWLDDGKIGGVIEAVNPLEARVRIKRAKPGGSKLLAEKGINLPDSDLRINGLTKQDIANLPFVAKYADMVALSFLREDRDVSTLQKELEKIRAKNLGIVFKIETKKALINLPSILLCGMQSFPIGVMIARGDLAVECGFELLAEAQEEILWICEASHVPVIWATQVLENLNKEGQPSRAEISDAAMSVRAECVMLNKGPHVIETLKMLNEILKRMEERQYKKKTYLKKLAFAPLETKVKK